MLIKRFLLLAILIHGFIIFSIDLQPISSPHISPVILVMLRQLPILKTESISKKSVNVTNINTDAKIARLSKSLEKKFDAYAKRPHRRAVSAGTTDQRYLNYLEKWRHKVELVGNQNYPETARRLKLRGDLILQVTLTADGNVQQAHIIHSSGNQILDDAAIRIVQLAAPFEPFPKEIRNEVEILDITRTWQFISSIAYSKGKIGDTNQIKSSFSMLHR